MLGPSFEKRGARGNDGAGARSGRVWGTDGDDGESLGDFTIPLGPLDPNWPPRRLVRLNAVGGSGGTAILRFDPDAPPQQFVIGELAASAGGNAGQGKPPGRKGEPGARTQLRFVE